MNAQHAARGIRRLALALVAVAAPAVAATAATAATATRRCGARRSATADLTGTRTLTGLPGGLDGGGSYASGFDRRLEHRAVGHAGPARVHVHVQRLPDPDVGHLMLGLTEGCSFLDGCLASLQYRAGTTGDFLAFGDGDALLGTWGAATSNPGFPVGASFYGVKFESLPAAHPNALQIRFLSNRAAAWGDVYAKGGQSYAYNEGLLAANRASSSTLLFVARPDGAASVPTVVPEPSTYALVGTGLLALVGVTRRRRARADASAAARKA
jgi:hypothetical protein